MKWGWFDDGPSGRGADAVPPVDPPASPDADAVPSVNRTTGQSNRIWAAIPVNWNRSRTAID